MVRSKSYNIPILTPVAEYDSESSTVGSVNVRRHSVCQMTSCLEETAFAEVPPMSCFPSHAEDCEDVEHHTSASSSPIFSDLCCNSVQEPGVHQDISVPSRSSSPETVVDQILESLDSDNEGIFIDFRRQHSSSSEFSRRSESVE